MKAIPEEREGVFWIFVVDFVIFISWFLEQS
jgi:hypothetical protein